MVYFSSLSQFIRVGETGLHEDGVVTGHRDPTRVYVDAMPHRTDLTAMLRAGVSLDNKHANPAEDWLGNEAVERDLLVG